MEPREPSPRSNDRGDGEGVGQGDLGGRGGGVAVAPLAAVVDTAFTWGDDRSPMTPWHKTLIYEVHVKGFTKRMEGVPEKARGTYTGLASEAAVQHLRDLGVTAVELMPLPDVAEALDLPITRAHQCVRDGQLVALREIKKYK